MVQANCSLLYNVAVFHQVAIHSSHRRLETIPLLRMIPLNHLTPLRVQLNLKK